MVKRITDALTNPNPTARTQLVLAIARRVLDHEGRKTVTERSCDYQCAMALWRGEFSGVYEVISVDVWGCFVNDVYAVAVLISQGLYT